MCDFWPFHTNDHLIMTQFVLKLYSERCRLSDIVPSASKLCVMPLEQWIHCLKRQLKPHSLKGTLYKKASVAIWLKQKSVSSLCRLLTMAKSHLQLASVILGMNGPERNPGATWQTHAVQSCGGSVRWLFKGCRIQTAGAFFPSFFFF